MWYIGSRTKKGCHPDDGYICSSKIVEPLIRNNPNDWIREIIEIGENPKDVREREKQILVEKSARQDPKSYNQSNAEGDFSFLGRKHDDETKIRIGKNQPDKSGEKNPCYGRVDEKHPMFGTKWDEDTNNKRKEKCKLIVQTEEQKKKNSISQTGKIWITDGIYRKRVNNDNEIPHGWWKGCPEEYCLLMSKITSGENHPLYGVEMTENTKNKIARSLEGHKQSDDTKKKKKISSKNRSKKICIGCGKQYLDCHKRYHIDCTAK